MKNLLFTVTQYLSKQANKTDKDIAVLLTYAEASIEESTSYSNRWNCCWATAILEIPYEVDQYFTEDILKRITEVLQKFRPRDWTIDFYSTEIQLRNEIAYDNWQIDILKNIAQVGLNNQAIFDSSNHPMCDYKGLRFRSQSERKLMIEFEKRTDILVFPLPAVVCGSERKEPDYFVVKNGKVGILEVVNDHFHPSVVNEANRTQWFQNHSIQVRSYDSNQCYNNPNQVINDFITWLENTK